MPRHEAVEVADTMIQTLQTNADIRSRNMREQTWQEEIQTYYVSVYPPE
jgi:hypothetical protein